MNTEQDTTIQEETTQQEKDFLNMSDDEFLQQSETDSTVSESNETEDENQEEEEEVSDESNEEVEESTESEEIDYKAAYERILGPIKANGKEIHVNNIDDAITLMQKGADYHRKTTELKPLRKVLATLKQNDLLDQDKLNYLIDLNNKNPDAIKKLIKDSNLDVFEEDLSEVNYKPNSYQVDDKVIELDEVLDSIQHTPQFETTVQILANQLDQVSKNTLSENPQIIPVLNEHIGNGIYKTIMDVVQNERTFGRLNDVSDLEAYRLVGDWIQANGGFNTNTNTATQEQPVKQSIKAKPVQDNKEKKKAASITNTKPTPKINVDSIDFLNMSDEEFAKLDKSLFT
jgi:hypothetical protein